MRKLLQHILSPVFLAAFGLILIVFHTFQWIAWNLFGDMAHRRVVYLMNYSLSRILYILGHRVRFYNNPSIPDGRPLIIVANHNSLHDIPTMYWYMRKYHPVFVSKLSLAKGLPSVSYNLRKSGAALIDRGDRRQALKEIMRLGTLINDRNFSAVIFPEGTRKGKELKAFKPGGVAALLKKAPGALIVPVAIKGTMDINLHKKYPLNIFRRLEWHVLDGIESSGRHVDDLMHEAREAIKNCLESE